MPLFHFQRAGSEGKLAVADQKVSVLQGIGNLFYNTVSGTSSLQELATKVTELFLPTLQQEGEHSKIIEWGFVRSLPYFSCLSG